MDDKPKLLQQKLKMEDNIANLTKLSSNINSPSTSLNINETNIQTLETHFDEVNSQTSHNFANTLNSIPFESTHETPTSISESSQHQSFSFCSSSNITGSTNKRSSNIVENRNESENEIEGCRLTQYTPPVSSYVPEIEIFAVLRNDDVTNAIRNDELIIKYGYKLAEKYSSEQYQDMIRANLRLLGRFILEIKKIDPSVNELKDIFWPSLFDKCVMALRNVASWDETKLWFRTPAVATSLTSLIKKCGKMQRAELIKSGCEDLKNELEKFLTLWEKVLGP